MTRRRRSWPPAKEQIKALARVGVGALLIFQVYREAGPWTAACLALSLLGTEGLGLFLRAVRLRLIKIEKELMPLRYMRDRLVDRWARGKYPGGEA